MWRRGRGSVQGHFSYMAIDRWQGTRWILGTLAIRFHGAVLYVGLLHHVRERGCLYNSTPEHLVYFAHRNCTYEMSNRTYVSLGAKGELSFVF